MPHLSIEPPFLHFPFNSIASSASGDVVLVKKFRVRNIGSVKTRLQYRPPPRDSGFTLVAHKKGYIYPGESEVVEIQFRPKRWDHIQDLFYVCSNVSPMIPVRFHAFPALLNTQVPSKLNFGQQSLFQKKTKTIHLLNDTPVDFEFQVSVLEMQPANSFSIWPQEGDLLAQTKTAINIGFMPLALCKAFMTVSIHTDQFAFVPIQLTVNGTGQLLIPRSITDNEETLSTSIPTEETIEEIEKQQSSEPKRMRQPVPETQAGDKKPELFNLFDEELLSREKIQKRKDLCRFVSIGEIIDTEVTTKDNNDTLQKIAEETGSQHDSSTRLQNIGAKTAEANLLKQIDIDSLYIPESVNKNVRIKVPKAPLQKSIFNTHNADRPDERLIKIFVNAGWAVIYRIRADKRIKNLQLSRGEEAFIKPKEEHISYLQKRLENAVSQPVNPGNYRYVSNKKYDVPVLDVTPFARPTQVKLMTTSYFERMGYKLMKKQAEDDTVKIVLPAISFANSAEKPKLNEEKASLKVITLTEPPCISIFNPIPSVEAIKQPRIAVHDETSPQYIFHTQHSYLN